MCKRHAPTARLRSHPLGIRGRRRSARSRLCAACRSARLRLPTRASGTSRWTTQATCRRPAVQVRRALRHSSSMSQVAGSSGRRSVDRRIPARRPRAFTLVALISLAAVAVGAVAWARSNVPLERADLEADPSFSLRMQGADELALVGSDRLFTFEGERPPFAGHIYGTMATSADVYAFYERELARLGWQLEAPPFLRSSAELENRVYCKRKVEFRLAI